MTLKKELPYKKEDLEEKVVDVANTRKYNEKIRDEVVKIQKKIGYGNSNIDDILSELDVFSERSGYFSEKLKTPAEKSAVNQFDEKIDLLNLPQNGKEKVTTGHGICNSKSSCF